MGRSASQPLTKYEKLYAKILYGQGIPQTDIAKTLNVSQPAISNAKKKDGDWEEFRMPELSYVDLISLLKTYKTRLALKLVGGELEDESRGVQDCMRLAGTLRDLQEQVDTVTVRSEILCCQNILRWLAENPREDALEAVQEYHDLKVKEL